MLASSFNSRRVRAPSYAVFSSLNTTVSILYMTALLEVVHSARAHAPREVTPRRHLLDRRAKRDQRDTVEDELYTHQEADEPQARGGQLVDEHEADDDRHDAGECGPSPTRETHAGRGYGAEDAADDEERGQKYRDTRFAASRVADEQIARHATQQCAEQIEEEAIAIVGAKCLHQ